MVNVSETVYIESPMLVDMLYISLVYIYTSNFISKLKFILYSIVVSVIVALT